MTERDATYYPGVYDYVLQTSSLGTGANTPYTYYIDATIDSSTTYINEGEMVFLNGIEQFGGLSAAQDVTLSAIPTAADVLTEFQNDSTFNIHRMKLVMDEITHKIYLYDSTDTLQFSCDAFMDSAMTQPYDGTAPVVATSWKTSSGTFTLDDPTLGILG